MSESERSLRLELDAESNDTYDRQPSLMDMDMAVPDEVLRKFNYVSFGLREIIFNKPN